MKKNAEMSFVKVLETNSLTDVALIKGALDGEKIHYYLQGETVNFLRPWLEPVLVWVASEDVDDAVELLKPLKLSYSPFHWGK